MISMPILDVSVKPDQLGFDYGPGVVGPATELRSLDAIRGSLLDPHCNGPDPVYGIVAFAAGRLGQEPIRSQGHVHAIAPHSGWSPPELFEVLEGKAIVYAQRSTDDDPGTCVAVLACERDKVVVPPDWAHCVINANPARRMVFGAWCDRQFGFVYHAVRAHGGLAWFPVLNPADEIGWRANPAYRTSKLNIHAARAYPELNLVPGSGIYQQFVDDPDSLLWVSDPARKKSLWNTFIP